MTWETQGRQDHGWFGNGTSGQDKTAPPRPGSPEDVAYQVAHVASDHLSRLRRSEYERFTRQDGGERLIRSIGIWTLASGLDPAAFHRTVAGAGMNKAGAAALQSMGQTLASGDDPASINSAGKDLAAALSTTDHSGLPYSLSYAQDQAVYASVQGLIPDGPSPVQAMPDQSTIGQKGEPPIVLAAAGDLKCQGIAAGCGSGGSRGTTAMYSVRGRNLCADCATKAVGATGETGIVKFEMLDPYILKGK